MDIDTKDPVLFDSKRPFLLAYYLFKTTEDMLIYITVYIFTVEM